MSEHEREGRTLLLGECHELAGKVAYHVSVACGIVRKPEAIQDREQQ